MTVSTVNNSLSAIRTKVRRLTASPGQSTLTTAILDEYINTFYSNDFPYAIKIDQMRSVYTFYTEPYVDKYPLDVNFNQGIRYPAYVDGIAATFFKDRQQFFNLWPRFPTRFTQAPTILSEAVTGATIVGTVVRVNSTNHGLSTGAVITISGVGGMVEINDLTFTITVTNANTFTLDNVDGTGYSAYTGGGIWIGTVNDYNFTISGPFLRGEVILGGIDVLGNALNICDDGNGNLNYTFPNPVVQVPASNYLANGSPIPGMKNLNTANPGLQNPTLIGTVNYVTGEFQFTLPANVSLSSTSEFTIRVSQYQPGTPYSILFFNNYFQIRPIPEFIHKVEIETYLTPVQFFQETDCPILNQWWQYIAIGAAIKIFEDRGDFDGVNAMMPMFNKQESLILERQGVEEIGQQNVTIYNSVINNPGCNNPGWY